MRHQVENVGSAFGRLVELDANAAGTVRELASASGNDLEATAAAILDTADRAVAKGVAEERARVRQELEAARFAGMSLADYLSRSDYAGKPAESDRGIAMRFGISEGAAKRYREGKA